MRKPSRFLVFVAMVTVIACFRFPAAAALANPAPLSPATYATTPVESSRPEEVPPDAVSSIARAFPERKTGSYGASRFLSYLAGKLQKEGWSTRILPYTNVTKTVSQSEKNIVYIRATGANLLALGSTESKKLDYLIIAPYDNVFPDDPEDVLTSSATLVSAALALELAHRLDRSALEFGMAFVSGHYQNAAGLWALLDVLDEDGIAVDGFLVLGDLPASGRLPLVPGPKTPVSFVETVMEAAATAGLDPFIADDRTHGRRHGPALVSGTISPEAPLGESLRGEHDVLADLGLPVLTVGFSLSDPTVKLSRAAAPAASLGEKLRSTAETVARALDSPLSAEGPVAGEMPCFILLGKSRYVPRNVALGAGLCTAAALAAVAVARLPRDLSALFLPAGTCAASALAMFLNALFSNRPSARYASRLFPGRSLLLVFFVFSLLVLLAFLRLWSTRSRIHHVRELSGIGQDPAGDRKVWGSAWSLAILAALTAGAAYTQSEMLPSLMIGGVSHGIATLLLKPPAHDEAPSPYALWPARLLYLAPLLGVFWAGNPFEPGAQAVYLASWTGLNRGSVVSALSLGVVAASVISTLRMPRPLARKYFLPVTFFEVLGLALILVSGFMLPPSHGPEIRAWAVAQETYDREPALVFSTPVPIREVSLVRDGSGDSGKHTSISGFKSLPLRSASEFEWADVTRSTSEMEEEKALGDGSLLRELVVDFRLRRRPDAVSVHLFEAIVPRTNLQGFQIHGLDTLLGCSPEDLDGETSVELPPGHSITVTWWNTVDLPDSLSYAAKPFRGARITHRYQALYFDASYAGLSPVSEGIRYYGLTSYLRQYVGQ
jgi:hypothetical protein